MPHVPFALLLALGSVIAPAADGPGAGIPSDPAHPRDIVVVAERLRAEVASPAPIEVSLDSAAITGLGASSLADILAQIASLTGSAQSRSGDGPVLLVNGRRIGSFEEVRNLPPEAIARVDVLPEEAALRLGYPASAKPVNIVLKPRYASATGELEDRVTTRGLRNDFNTELNVVDIAGDNRLTLDLQYQIGDAISEDKRGLVRPLDRRAASASGIVTLPPASLPNGAGLVGIPASGRTLAEFLATAPADDTGRYRTVVPSTHQFTAAGALARALGKAMTLSVTARFDRLTADDLMGPGIADYLVPQGPANPFGAPVRVRRALADQTLVNRNTRTDTYHLGAQLAGFGRWQWSLAGNYDRVAVTRQRTGTIDTTLLQTALDQFGLADPFGRPPAGTLAIGRSSFKRSRDEWAGVEAFVSGPVWQMPAGATNLALRGTLSRETISTTSDTVSGRLARTRTAGQVSLDIPLLTGHSAIGSLDVNANAAIDRFSDVGTLHGYGASLVWKPTKQVSLLTSMVRDQTVPLMTDRGAPVDVTADTLLFDFGNGRTATVSRTDGGNSALKPDARRIAKAELAVKPLAGLALTGTYTHTIDRNPIIAFPGIAGPVESELPGLIVRDAAGTALAVDARPFNAAREVRQDLRLALTFSKSFRGAGKSGAPRVPGGGTFGGGHAFGASGSMIQLALSDTVRLQDRLTLAPGAPPVDLVGLNPLGDGLRVPRHRLEAQLSATHHGFGLRANAGWFAGGVAGADGADPLSFGDRAFLNFRLFWFPEKTGRLASAAPWLHGVRFLLAVDNAFDNQQRVTDRTGLTPLSYQRGLLDPLGRTLRLSIRKTLE